MNYPEPGMPDLRLVLSEEATNDQPEAPELLELRGVKKRAAEIILEAPAPSHCRRSLCHGVRVPFSDFRQ